MSLLLILMLASAASQGCDNACGDLNGDGHVTREDARIALERSVGLPFPAGDPGCLQWAADPTGDGLILANDAVLIVRVAEGIGGGLDCGSFDLTPTPSPSASPTQTHTVKPTATPTYAGRIAEYLPLERGKIWHYDNNGEAIDWRVELETISRCNNQVLVETDSGDGSRQYYRFRGEQLLLHGVVDGESQETLWCNPPIVIGDGLLLDGKSYISAVNGGALQIVAQYNAVGTVRVPYGTFDNCFRLTLLATAGSQSQLLNAWTLAPRVGRVEIFSLDAQGNETGRAVLVDVTSDAEATSDAGAARGAGIGAGRIVTVAHGAATLGGEARVDVSINGIRGIAGGNLILVYDAEAMAAVDVEPGEALDDFEFAHHEGDPGQLHIGWMHTTGVDLAGEHVALRVRFRAVPGVTGRQEIVGFTPRLFDENGALIASEMEHGAVFIGPARGDVNGDETVDHLDGLAFARHWSRSR